MSRKALNRSVIVTILPRHFIDIHRLADTFVFDLAFIFALYFLLDEQVCRVADGDLVGAEAVSMRDARLTALPNAV